jgi:glucosylceramidase
MHAAGRPIWGIAVTLLLAACGKASSDGASGGDSGTEGGGPGAEGGTGGAMTAATGGGAGGSTTGGTGASRGGAASAGAPSGTGGGSGAPSGAGTGDASGSPPTTGGAAGTGGSEAGLAGLAGMAGLAAGAGTPFIDLPPLVTSAPGTYWKTDGALAESTADALVTVDDTATAQTWDGFGGAFNELGLSYLTSNEMVTAAVTLLFSAADGAAFSWGRIPIGANDYATSRYTLDDDGTDVTPSADELNRPAPDVALALFSLERDGRVLIPAIKAAQAVKPDLRFWASPWTPPVWMKTGYSQHSRTNDDATKPSFYDGGSMRADAQTLAAYAQYFKRFVEGYREQGIDIRVVSPQSEPSWEFNYPSCLWDKVTYTTFIRDHLGPAMKELGVDVMLGTLSNGESGKDFDVAKAVLADSAATSFLKLIGAQWNAMDQAQLSDLGSTLPVWATEHKGGNYPWQSPYSSTAPNDHAYGIESWYYIRDAITKLRVTTYNAWNMVLDKYGWSIDTSNEWAQDALLVADEGTVTPTPAYYVFRHLSQYVVPGATVLGTTGGDAVAFRNLDGSLVAVLFNGGEANDHFVVALAGKKFAFAMPANGWATLKYKP